MVTKDEVVGAVNRHSNRVLSFLELVVPTDKFPVCRKLILDEFGRDGLAKTLDELFLERKREERDGMGGTISRKKDGAA